MKNEAHLEHPLDLKDYPLSCSFHNQSFSFPLHYHQELEMIYVEKGSISVSVMQKDYVLKEGQLAIIGCNHIHTYNHIHSYNHPNPLEIPVEKKMTDKEVVHGNYDFTEEGHIKFYIMLIDWNCLKIYKEDDELQKLLYPLLFDVNIFDTQNILLLRDVKSLFIKLSSEKFSDQPGKIFFQLGYLYQLVGCLIRTIPQDENIHYDFKQMEKEHALLSKVNAFIFESYTFGITLSSVSAALGYSEFHFSRQFKNYTGITFKQYLTQYQISMAKEDVLDNQLPITEIVFKHGFNSVKTFNRLFKAYYGEAPTLYRKRMKGLEK